MKTSLWELMAHCFLFGLTVGAVGMIILLGETGALK